MYSLKIKSGFTLVEIIVALTVLMISLLGFYQISLFTISQINNSDKRLTSINYLFDGIEIVRGIRDTFLGKNVKSGWDNPYTPEIDSFLEFLDENNDADGEFVLKKMVSPDDQDIIQDETYINGFTLISLNEPNDPYGWEKLDLSKGFVSFYRKIRIEDYNVPDTDDSLKKITVSVYFEDGSTNDVIHMTTYLGDIGMTYGR